MEAQDGCIPAYLRSFEVPEAGLFVRAKAHTAPNLGALWAPKEAQKAFFWPLNASRVNVFWGGIKDTNLISPRGSNLLHDDSLIQRFFQ